MAPQFVKCDVNLAQGAILWGTLDAKESPQTRVFFVYLNFFSFKSSIIKPTTLNTNEQEAIRGTVADPVACVVSMPPKYQHVVSSLGSEE